MLSRYKFSSEELSVIGSQIVAGQALDALERLGAVGAEPVDVREREFLIGCAYAELGRYKDAIRHYLISALGGTLFLPALIDAAALLSKSGYKREAAFLYDKARLTSGIINSSEDAAMLKELEAVFHQHNESNSVVAIHQPAYLPWLGFFHKIFYADKFVVLDNVEFSKNSFIKRTLINKTHLNEGAYLTIPAAKHSDYISINEMTESVSEDWRTAHLRKIHGSYNRSKYFKEFYPVISKAMDQTRGTGSIVKINGTLLGCLLDILNLRRETILSSELLKIEIEDPHERNIAICEELGGNVYFSGAAAIDYQRGRDCPAGLRLIYQKMWEHVAAQPYLPAGQFTNGLSILDALFTVGPEKILDMFESYNDPRNGYCF